jgi:hypothetical protein
MPERLQRTVGALGAIFRVHPRTNAHYATSRAHNAPSQRSRSSGHNVSDEAGMLEMAQWIEKVVPELPVQLITSGEPFWTPK